jgi:hypothetical protein
MTNDGDLGDLAAPFDEILRLVQAPAQFLAQFIQEVIAVLHPETACGATALEAERGKIGVSSSQK